MSVVAFPVLAKRLADERGMTVSRVCTMATVATQGDVSPHTVQAQFSGKRRPSIEVMEAVAEVLGVHPSTFAEHRLAVARRAIDEEVVGLDAAIAELEG